MQTVHIRKRCRAKIAIADGARMRETRGTRFFLCQSVGYFTENRETAGKTVSNVFLLLSMHVLLYPQFSHISGFDVAVNFAASCRSSIFSNKIDDSFHFKFQNIHRGRATTGN